MSNVVTNILDKVAGARKLTEIDGDIIVQSGECEIKGTMGGVYGMAVEIENAAEKKAIFEAAENKDSVAKGMSVDEWKPIDSDGKWYPIYWGADLYLGSRLRSHTGKLTGTNSIYLIDKPFLNGKKIVYGGILCEDYLEVEKDLHRDYKDLFKTTNKNKIEKTI